MEEAMPDLGACQHFQDQIDELEQEIQSLEDDLADAPPTYGLGSGSRSTRI
jgi:hypothetical protein